MIWHLEKIFFRFFFSKLLENNVYFHSKIIFLEHGVADPFSLIRFED